MVINLKRLQKNTSYIGYCKALNRIGLVKKLGASLKSKNLINIAKFLNENYHLIPNEVISASIMTFFLVFIPLCVILSQINFMMGIIISFLIAYFGASKVLSRPIAEYNQIQSYLLQYSDLAFQDFLSILNTTNSIFDAIKFVSIAHYPILSEKFKIMMLKIIFYGKSPESLTLDFINSLPNGSLKERLLNIMATRFHTDRILEQLETLGGEKKFEYTVTTQQLEGKIVVFVVICLFFPVIFSIFIAFLGPIANLLGFLIIPIYFLLIQKLKSRFLRVQFELFGEANILEKEEFGSDNTELVDFIQFLTFFGNELKRGLPQELAMLKAFHSYHGPLKISIKQSISEMQQSSFRQGWNKLKLLLDDPQTHFLIELINRMLKKSSLETGNRLISTIQQLKLNRELIRERESVIKAQQFKIKFLIFLSAAILGLISGITPFLMKMGIVLGNPEAPFTFSIFDTLPLILSLLVMGIYSAYFLAKLVKINRPIQYPLWFGIVFISLCYISVELLLSK